MDEHKCEKSFELHQTMTNRMTKVETTLDYLKDRQEKHEEKFETMFEQMTKSLVNIEMKLTEYMATQKSSSNTFEKIIKMGWPILVALATVSYYIIKHKI
jgi:hypothetical protein